MISCILLSAGLSRRFGSPKALASWKGTTVIGHIQNMLVLTQVDEIIVVLGAQADAIKPHLLKHKKVKFVYNKDYNFGQTSSFKAGIGELSKDTKGILLYPVDFPMIARSTVDGLIKVYAEQGPLIMIPMFNGRKGHPPLFSGILRSEFLGLDNSLGINSVAHAHEPETALFTVNDPGTVAGFNTPEEFEALKAAG